MENIRHKDMESRQGIALIMVVGVLALMMVMAVAFAIFMRTERVSAGSFKNDIRARNLLQVALSRAVDAIDADMIASNCVCPRWEIFQNNTGVFVGEPLTKKMLDQIPLAALTAQGNCIEGTANSLVINSNVPGAAKGAVINITDHSFGIVTNLVNVSGATRVEHTTLSGGRVNTWRANDQYYFLQPSMVELGANEGVGRYGYVVINCSGLLDANSVGGMARGLGTNVMEIQLGSLPEGVSTNDLITQRQLASIETHQELIGRLMTNGVFADYPEHFICYSSAATNNDGRVYIGGTAAELVSRRDQIIGALTNLTYQDTTTPSASFSLQEAETLFTNLVDFVDDDNIPGNLGDPASPGNPSGPCVERIPMANEIVVTNRIEYNLDSSMYPGATNYIMSGVNIVSVEFMAPVLNQSPVTGGPCTWAIALEGISGNANIFPALGRAFTNNLPYGGFLLPYTVKTIRLPMVGDSVSKPIDLTPIVNNIFNVKVITRMAGVTVDLVTNPGVLLNSITINISPSGGLNQDGVRTQYVGIGVGGKECVDPRLNGDANNWVVSRAMTLGTTNLQALIRINPYLYGNQNDRNNYGRSSKGKDGDTLMYVANAPLSSVGDLGYLFFGNPWETVRLFRIGDDPLYGKMHAVLDHFTVDNPAGGILRGRVNPNTRLTEVLSAVFTNMPLGRRHNSTTLNMMNPTQLDAVTMALMNWTATNRFNSLAELGAIRWDLVFPSLNSLDRESIIRNSSRIFDVRQNLFIILLYSDVTKRDLDGNSVALSSVRGVAEVWRDPVDVANHYPINVHLFQIME